ncbi:hypothetical protein LIER_12470 [Lithospermum erythrorhizon]|uniref:CCHC-type domain-containing protein n=1 Tax=Lithospermum erythrorhizon TaxID=34254 RepID=A0AAV3PX37_LITER
MGIEGELMVQFAAYRFHDEARVCWTNLHRSLIVNGQIPMTWDRFVEIFNENYCLSTHISALERELIQLNQGRRTINEYEKRFNELCRQMCLIKNVALKVEMEQVEFQARRDKSGRQDMSSNSGQGNSGFQGRPVWGSNGTYRERHESGRCFRCGSTDHRVLNCPKKVIYFLCQQVRHIATNCHQFQGISSGTGAYTPMQPIRGGFQSGCGGRFGGRANQGRGAGNGRGADKRQYSNTFMKTPEPKTYIR